MYYLVNNVKNASQIKLTWYFPEKSLNDRRGAFKWQATRDCKDVITQYPHNAARLKVHILAGSFAVFSQTGT
jgi:hypothetical protein